MLAHSHPMIQLLLGCNLRFHINADTLKSVPGALPESPQVVPASPG